MESNGELKKTSIKSRTCQYFDDIIKFKDFDLHNILIDEKSHMKLFWLIAFHTKL